jgi:hypothetical protein
MGSILRCMADNAIALPQEHRLGVNADHLLEKGYAWITDGSVPFDAQAHSAVRKKNAYKANVSRFADGMLVIGILGDGAEEVTGDLEDGDFGDGGSRRRGKRTGHGGGTGSEESTFGEIPTGEVEGRHRDGTSSKLR